MAVSGEWLLECVPNVSEGRRRDVVDDLAAACGPPLLDVHSDPDHHRSVFTLAGAVGTEEPEAAARRLAMAVAERIDLRSHHGVHPRLGALDVVPFVALPPAPPDAAVAAARRFATWLGGELGVPAFLYDDADPRGRSLPEVRSEAFKRASPDSGPAQPHPQLGATAVGARPLLVAVNCELDTTDVSVARAVAAEVRERGGGLPGVRALGLELAGRRHTQVSMNLVDLGATGVERACREVKERVRARGADVVAVELVGLVPEAEAASWSAEFRGWRGVDAGKTIEARLRAAGLVGRVGA